MRGNGYDIIAAGKILRQLVDDKWNADEEREGQQFADEMIKSYDEALTLLQEYAMKGLNTITVEH